LDNLLSISTEKKVSLIKYEAVPLCQMDKEVTLEMAGGDHTKIRGIINCIVHIFRKGI
jgi:hypothetical protein